MNADQAPDNSASCQNQEVEEIIEVVQKIVNAVSYVEKLSELTPAKPVGFHQPSSTMEPREESEIPAQVQLQQSPPKNPLQCPKCSLRFTCASMIATHSKICGGYNLVTATTNGKDQIALPVPVSSLRLEDPPVATATSTAPKITIRSRYSTRAWDIAQKSEARDTLYQLICPLCNKSIHRSRPILELHLRRHFHEYIYSCKWCNLPFIAFGELVIHVKKCQKIQSPSELQVSPPNRVEASDKVAKDDPSTPKIQPLDTFTADEFEKIRKTTKAYKISQACQPDHHSVFNCEVCGTFYSFRRSALEYHLRKHFQEHVSFCRKCQLGFFSLYQFKSHDCGIGHVDQDKARGKRKQTLLPRKARRVFKSSKNSMQKTETKPNPAVALPNRANCKSEAHEEPSGADAEERPYKCEVCDARFSKSSTVSRHMKVRHKSEAVQVDTESCEVDENLAGPSDEPEQKYPFNCDSCQRGFLNQANFSRHVQKRFCRASYSQPSESVTTTPKKPSKFANAANRKRRRRVQEQFRTDEKPVVGSSTPSPPVLKAMTRLADDVIDYQDFDESPPTLEYYPKTNYFRKDRPFQCTSCRRGFFSEVAFGKHVKFCCQDKSTEKKSKLNQKLLLVRYPWLHEFLNGPYCYECKACDCKFTRESIAEEHRQWHIDWDL